MYRLNKLSALVITAVFILAAFVVFVLNLSKISLPDDYEELDSKIVGDTVKIYRNQYGIPHIVAKNEKDAFFMMGYSHAQDRLWQMDFLRRAARGQLSEILGSRTVNVDKFMRSLNISRTSAQIWKSMPAGTKSLLEAYSNGVNYFVESHKDALQFEFNALSYFPEKWSPTDCIAIGRQMAFQMSMGFWNDMALGEIADKAGMDKASELIPSYPSSAPHVLDDTAKIKIKADSSKAASPTAFNEALEYFNGFNSALLEIRETLGIKGSSFGSNSWAVRKYQNRKRVAILANDPHLMLSLPPIWYQMHISCPTINVTGLTIPGIPFALVGRNNHIAWGITNIMIDDCDYFIEKIDDKNKNFYITPDGNKAKFIYKADTIKVKDSIDIFYYIRYTNRSAVISDFHIFRSSEDVIDMKSSGKRKGQYLDKYCITYSWTGNKISDEVTAMYKVMKSKNWQQFISALRQWGTPGQNFTYADDVGNIGIYPAGSVPQRGPACSPNLPNPAWVEGSGWVDIISAWNFPTVYNPPKNYVASANNKTSRALNFYVSNYWEPSSRIERITELLNMTTDYNVREAQLMQMDFLSPYARKMMSHILPVLEARKNYMTNTEKKALALLAKWDFIMDSRSSSPSIYNAFLRNYIHNTFADELGERLYRQYVLVSNVPTRRIMEITADSSNIWFDDVMTKKPETRENIIFLSFRNAIEELTGFFKSQDVYRWKYGKIHTLSLDHVFSENKFLNRSVTQGPFEIGGNLTTINNTEWQLFKPYDAVLGASMRFITDMSDSLVYTSVPGGASGDPMSVNYANQVQLWLNGGYVRISSKYTPNQDFELSVVINPVRE